ncbi:MAG: hypothetical protein M0P21_10830 [Methanoculleus sp.]|jgi:hypothetical protein|nr:hypothetical protein [Methanoculleus sp.]
MVNVLGMRGNHLFPVPGGGGFKGVETHHVVDFEEIARTVRPEPAFSIRREDIRL